MSDELLLVVVDATASSWSVLDAEAERLSSSSSSSDGSVTPRLSSFPEFLVTLETFLSAFATTSRRNRLAVIAYNGLEGGYLYPPPPPSPLPVVDSLLQSSSKILNEEDLLRPAVIKRFVRRGLLRLRYGTERCTQAVMASVSAQNNATSTTGTTTPIGSYLPVEDEESLTRSFPVSSRFNSLGNCLTLALCFSQRLKRESTVTGKRPLPSRIVVFKAADDVPASYINVINAAFSAHRLSIPIDSCVIGSSQSPYLQQSAYLTQGITLRPDVQSGHHAHLVQYLLSLFLPDSKTRRNELLMPPQLSVDLKATCFCHKKGVSQAFLCFVCLSVWCVPSDVCATCGTSYRMNKF